MDEHFPLTIKIMRCFRKRLFGVCAATLLVAAGFAQPYLKTGTAASSSVYSTTYPASLAFDDNLNSSWRSSSTFPQQLEFAPADAKVVNHYQLLCSQMSWDYYGYYRPKSWNLQAWDGAQWLNLDTVTAYDLPYDQFVDFPVANTTAYAKYRLNVSASSGGNYVFISELRLFDAGYVPMTLSGTYTVGQGGDFTTIKSAVDTLKKYGVSGPVTFKILKGLYAEQVTLTDIYGASATNTITFTSATGIAADVQWYYASSGSSDNYVVNLASASYLYFDKIQFLNTSNSAYCNIITLNGYCRNISFTRNEFMGNTVSGSTTKTHISTSDARLDSITIDNNTFNSNYISVYFDLYSSILSKALRFTNNTVNTYMGVYFSYSTDIAISNNTFKNLTGDPTINIYYSGNFTVSNNVISTTSDVTALYLHDNNSAACPKDKRLVFNNYLETASGQSGDYTMYVYNTDSLQMYHNTLVRNGSNYATFFVSSSKGLSIQNNYFYSMLGQAMFATSSSFVKFDYNNFFTSGFNAFYWDDNVLKSLKEIQAYNTSFNQHSTFVNASIGYKDGRFNSRWLDGTGAPVAAVTKDLAGASRDASKPDVGAFEFTATTGVPLSGNLVVNAQKAPYKTLKAVFDSLQVRGVDGKVNVLLEDDAYEEQYTLAKIPGSDRANTITVRSAPARKTQAAIGYSAAGTSDNFILKLRGVDNICLKNIQFFAGSNDYSNAIMIGGSCGKIQVDSCDFVTLTSSSSSNKYFIVDEQYMLSDSIIISNNTFTKNRTAISLYAYNWDSKDFKNGYIEIRNNKLTGQYVAMVISRVTNAYVQNNNISGFTNAGIYAEYVSNYIDIRNNKLFDATSSGNYGIQVAYSNGALNRKLSVVNNVVRVSNFNYAFYSYNNNYIDVVGNTFYNRDDVASYSTGGSNVSFRNNINYTTSFNKVFYYGAGVVNTDYNSYFTFASNLGTWGTQVVKNLGEMHTLYSKDLNSVFANPGFNSIDSLVPSSKFLDGTGVYDTVSKKDIAGASRQNPCDIGAYEFTSKLQPLHGVYYIQKDTGDYKTVADAVKDLNTYGISANVTFEIAGGTYTEGSTIYPISGASASDSVVFEPASSDSVYFLSNASLPLSIYAEGYNWRQSFTLQSTSYVSFKNLNFRVKKESVYTNAMFVLGSVNNINVLGCSFLIDATSKTSYSDEANGIYFSNTSLNLSNILVDRCTFRNGENQIQCDCSSGDCSNMTITNNDFQGGLMAVYVKSVAGFVCSRNKVKSNAAGFQFYNLSKPATITNNTVQVDNFQYTYSESALYLNNCVGSFLNRILVANNMVYSTNPQYGITTYIEGIGVESCQFVDVVYNSVSLVKQHYTSGNSALWVKNGNNIRVMNNNLSNNTLGGYAYYVYSGSEIEQSDNNNFHVSSSTKFLYWGGDKATLSAFQLASAKDAASISVAPGYLSVDNLHTSSADLVGKATYYAKIDADFDGNPRDASTPDIGADEVYCQPANLDIRIPKICLGNKLSFQDSSKNVEPGTAYSWDFQNDGKYDATTKYAQNATKITGLPVGIATTGGQSSYVNGSNYPMNAFDGDTVTSGWGVYMAGNPTWLQYTFFEKPELVSAYSFYCSTNQNGGWTSNNYNPKSWIFQGSNDGTTWTDLDTRSNLTIKKDTTYTFAFSNVTSYSNYRIFVQSAQGGTSTYTYITELKLKIESTENSSVDYLYNIAGDYVLKLKASQIAGCVDSATFTVKVDGNVPVADAGADVSICKGGSQTLNAKGNGTYAWSTNQSSASIVVTPEATQSYIVTVTSSTGCTDADTVQVKVAQPFAYTRPVNDTICLGDTSTLTVSGGTTHVWSTGKDTTKLVVSPLQNAMYKVAISDGNCTINDSAYVTVVNISASIDSIRDKSCYDTNDGYLSVLASGGVEPYKYTWTNGAQTKYISGLSTGTYTVTITDKKACSVMKEATVTTPDQLKSQTTITPTQCKIFDGKISVSATGGNGSYSFHWADGTDTNLVNNLPAGSYTFTVTDSKLCTTIATVDVPVMQKPTIAFDSIKNVTCFGGNDGYLSVAVNSSNGAVSYNWSDGNTGANISDLTVGTYKVIVADTAGCTDSLSVALQESNKIIYTVSKEVSICKNASITLYAAGGNHYSWSNNSTDPAITVSPKATQTYYVTISDGICQVSDSVTVSVSTLKVAALKGDATCFGNNNGYVLAQASGGLAPYTYAWNVPVADSSVTKIDNLMPGMYTVTVYDSHQCSVNATARVQEPPSLSVNVSLENSKCDEPTGWIKLDVSGGVSPYSYAWSNAQITDSISQISAGMYQVTVTDKQGCNIIQNITLNNINAPEIVTESLKNISCYGLSDGQILISGMQGTEPYSFKWSNGNTTRILTDLVAGDYVVTLTDSKNCQTISIISVSSPQPLTVIPEIGRPGCSMSNGNILLNITGGVKPYAILWGDSSKTLFANNVTAGVYTVSVTDANQCETKAQVNVSDANAPDVKIKNVINIPCSGHTGEVYPDVSGGTGSYLIQWSNGTSKLNLTNVGAGFYTITVTDENLCRGVNGAEVKGETPTPVVSASKYICYGDTVTLSAAGGETYLWSTRETAASIRVSPKATTTYTVKVMNGACSGNADVTVFVSNVSVSISGKNDATCYGLSNGSATALAANGFTPYTYKWSNGMTSSQGFVNGLPSGKITVTVSDAYSCKAFASDSIAQPSQIDIVFNITSSSCNQSDGAVSASVTGGKAPYTYLWANGDKTTALQNLSAGSYMFRVKDGNGCENSAPAMINDANSAALASTKTDVSCYGSTDGAIDLSISGGSSPYTMKWSTGQATEDISGLQVGPYDVAVVDAKGCKSYLVSVINQPSRLVLQNTVNPSTCQGSDGQIVVTATGGTPSYTYSWFDGAKTASKIGLAAGVFDVTATDSKGCSASATISIGEIGAPYITSDSVENEQCGSNNGAVYITALSVSGITSYKWSNGSIQADLTGVSAGKYSVSVSDANGCKNVVAAVVRPALPSTPAICLVTVGDESGKNLVVWDRQPNNNIVKYNVYRESTTKDVYQFIGSKTGDEVGMFRDTNSLSMVRSYRYRISTIDQCGNESALSPYHKTMHLTPNVGLDNTVNLIWDEYQGINFGSINIYRGTSTSDVSLLATIPAGNFTYRDMNPPSGHVVYKIGMELPYVCDPSAEKSDNGPYSQSLSNMAESELISTEARENAIDFELQVSPVPAKDYIIVKISNKKSTDFSISIIDRLGRENVLSSHNSQSMIYKEIDLSKYDAGTYQIILRADGEMVTRDILLAK